MSQAPEISDRPGLPSPVTYAAYGIELRSSFALATSRSAATAGPPIAAEVVSEDRLWASWSGADGPPVLVTMMAEGEELSVEQGIAGEHLVRYGTRGAFLISADTSLLLCSPERFQSDPGWQRILLDWVMYFAASLRALQALHASAVALDGEVIAFCAQSGGGKTTTALELLNRGGSLVCDDVLCLRQEAGVICGEPGAPFLSILNPIGEIEVGRSAGRIGPEEWVRINRVTQAAAPIGGIFLLDRSVEHSALTISPCSMFALRQHAIGLPHIQGGKELERFSLLSELMNQATVRLIEAPPDVSPQTLVEAAIECRRESGQNGKAAYR